jgi:hypothetical protein
MLTLKDIRHGDCWMYCGNNAPDRRPSIASYQNEGTPPGMPDSWDDYGMPREEDLANIESYFNCNKDRPVELLQHYGISPIPRPLRLKRCDLVPGDCFQYLNDGDDGKSPSGCYVVDGGGVHYTGLPSTWLVSTSGSSRARMNDPVRRVEHWDLERKPFVANPPQPVVLSCVDPFKDLKDQIFVYEEMVSDGMKGRECLARFERGQQTESIARVGDGFVCTNAECGLNEEQISHAEDLWAMKLRLKVAESKAADAARERLQVVCDDQYEL